MALAYTAKDSPSASGGRDPAPGRLAPLLPVLFGFFASLAYLAGELGLLLVAIAVLPFRVLPPPWGALPPAIFLPGVPLAVLALIVFREGMVLRQERTAGALAYLVWDAPEVLVGLAWSMLDLALFSGAAGASEDRTRREVRINSPPRSRVKRGGTNR
jgi:hypothetical protein